MHGSRSRAFNVGLAACGCLYTFPAVQWFWPFEDEWTGGQLIVAFAVSCAFALVVDRLVEGLVGSVERAVNEVQ